MITDYTGDIDVLIVPMLEWLRVNEPDILATKDQQQNGFTFKADVISDTASDISINLKLSERVIVKQVGYVLHVDHVGENPLLDNEVRPLQFHAGGALVSEWQQ